MNRHGAFNVGRSAPARSRLVVVLVVLAAIGGRFIAAQESATFAPDIRSFSGSPLLLEIDIPLPSPEIDAAEIETAATRLVYAIPDSEDRDSLRLVASPFLEPGVYDLAVRASAGETGETFEATAEAGFVDFVFGRDNLRFGNNASYESVIGTFGEILSEWLEARFGEVAPADSVLLVDYMYGLFGKNTGRCYGFSGSAIRYWKWPELLPGYYDETYDLRGRSSREQRAMNFLQFDMVYSRFFSSGRADLVFGPMTTEEITRETDRIIERISDGEPVAAGFTGPQLHHSMAVFGYVRNRAAGTVDLLVANNWKDDEDLNLHSRDAEIVRIRPDVEGEPPTIEWIHEDGPRDREIDRLFLVEVQKDDYVLEPTGFEWLAASRRDWLHANGRAVLVVEDVKGAWLTNGEDHSGRLRNRTRDELEGVTYDRVGRTFRFEYPAEMTFDLEIEDDAGARILFVAPGAGPGEEVASIESTTAPEDGATVIRSVTLAPGAPLATPLADASQQAP